MRVSARVSASCIFCGRIRMKNRIERHPSFAYGDRRRALMFNGMRKPETGEHSAPFVECERLSPFCCSPMTKFQFRLDAVLRLRELEFRVEKKN